MVSGIGEILAEQIAVAWLAVQIDRGLGVTRTVAIAVVAMIAITIAEVALPAMITVVAAIAAIAVVTRRLAMIAMIARLAYLAWLAWLARTGGFAHVATRLLFAAVAPVLHGSCAVPVGLELATLAATAAATATATAALFSCAARFVEAGEDRIVVVRFGGENIGAGQRWAFGLGRHDLGFARFAGLGGRGGFTISIHGMLPECEYAWPHLDDSRLAPVLLDQSR